MELTLWHLQMVCKATAPIVLEPFVAPLNATCAEFEITNRARQAAFLAQCAHESNGFRCLEENLNYRPERLLALWPRTPRRPWGFADLADAQQCAALGPEHIANRVYGNRKDLGNRGEASGDGWCHRGAGIIQLTGRANQLRCAEHFHVSAETIGEWLRTPAGGCRSAGWFWATHNLNVLADAGAIKAITRVINGGYNGLEDRVRYWRRALTVLPEG